MGQGVRADRVAEQLRQLLAEALARDVHDPGIGFVTLTRAKVSPDLQLARVYYAVMGNEKQKREAQRGLERATPFLRRKIAAGIRLRRVPELRFEFDQGVEHQDRIERILQDLAEERKTRDPAPGDEGTPDTPPARDEGDV
jgi:ribosome-binding factor A